MNRIIRYSLYLMMILATNAYSSSDKASFKIANNTLTDLTIVLTPSENPNVPQDGFYIEARSMGSEMRRWPTRPLEIKLSSQEATRIQIGDTTSFPRKMEGDDKEYHLKVINTKGTIVLDGDIHLRYNETFQNPMAKIYCEYEWGPFWFPIYDYRSRAQWKTYDAEQKADVKSHLYSALERYEHIYDSNYLLRVTMTHEIGNNGDEVISIETNPSGDPKKVFILDYNE